MEPSSSYNTFGQWFKYAAMSAMEFDRYLAESGKKDEKNPYTEVLKAVRQAIITCIGSMGWTDIDYSFAFQNLIIMHETMGVLPLEALSDGTRSVILSLIHISEPTRLGMISYAVFCLKKKKKYKI